MFDSNDVSTYTKILNQDLNSTLKVKDCVCFEWKHDKINKKIIYTLYKQVSLNDQSSIITSKNFDEKDGCYDINKIINEGKLFLDPDAKLEYPDTLEMRYDPIKNVPTHYILYRQGNIIFNIPFFVHIDYLNLYPTDLLKNVTKRIKHNGWYQEQIYPDVQKDRTAFYFTWQHITYVGLKNVLGLLVVCYTAKKIIPYAIDAYKK